MADQPTAVYRTDAGTLATVADDMPITCSWFVACTRPATDLYLHVILGNVPICRECADTMPTNRESE